MKRSRGIKLLVGLLLTITAYIVWCAHPFYQSPKLRYQASVPPEARRLIEEWFTKNQLGEPLPFSRFGFTYFLAHPYEAGGSDYDVTRESENAFRAIRFNDVEFRIVFNDGNWEQVHIPKNAYLWQ